MPLNFRDIPQFPRAYYEITTEWKYIEDTLKRYMERGEGITSLNLDPDYQRAHVWTKAQQIAYLEYAMQGGEVGRNITFNCPGWMSDWRGPFELIDGKQRIEAVRAFLRNEVKVFNHYHNEIEGRMPSDFTFNFRVCTIEGRVEILRFYLNINSGGTPHSKIELDRVRKLLAKAETNAL